MSEHTTYNPRQPVTLITKRLYLEKEIATATALFETALVQDNKDEELRRSLEMVRIFRKDLLHLQVQTLQGQPDVPDHPETPKRRRKSTQ